MTKWQKDYIKALATSPIAFDLFKIEQKNRKVLDQYTNRIWPYHTEKQNRNPTFREVCNTDKVEGIKVVEFSESEPTNSIDIESTIKLLMKNKNDLPKCVSIFRHLPRVKSNKYFVISDIEKLSSFTENLKNAKLFNIDQKINGEIIVNPVFSIVLDISKTPEMFSEKINSYYKPTKNKIKLSFYKELKLFEALYQILCRLSIENDKFIFRIHSIIIYPQNIYKCESVVKAMVYTLSLLNNLTKKKIVPVLKKPTILKRVGMNIGIEIEHMSDNGTSNEVSNAILNKNCKSYDSGFDGNCPARLRENRIRLDGIQGLKGLYTLLEDMKKNCFLDFRNSSVHMHIDCTHYFPKDNGIRWHMLAKIKGAMLEYLRYHRENKKVILLGNIFDIDGFSKVKGWSIIRPNNDFGTIEHRYCSVTLNYSEYVLQILALIHFTNAFIRRIPMNTKYLELLNVVKKELNEQKK